MNKPIYCKYAILAFLALVVPYMMAGAEVITAFQKGMELTKDDLSIVLSLAQKAGVTNVSRVATGHMSHSPERGVFVTESETVADGKIRQRYIFIERRQWMRETEQVDAHSIQLGDFWIRSINGVELTMLHIDEKEYRLSVAQNIPIATAEAILRKFLKGDYSVKEMEMRSKGSVGRGEIDNLKHMDVAKPIEFKYETDKKVYHAQFEGLERGGPSFYLTFRYNWWTGVALISCFGIQM